MGGIVSSPRRPEPPPPPPPVAAAPTPEPQVDNAARRQAAQRRARRSGRALISGSPLGITGEALATGVPNAPQNTTLGPG